jgi:predicted outer membrane repeat protein
MLTVSGCTVSGNNASTHGGGIYNAGTLGALTVSNSIFSFNPPENIYGPYTDGGGNTFK